MREEERERKTKTYVRLSKKLFSVFQNPSTKHSCPTLTKPLHEHVYTCTAYMYIYMYYTNSHIRPHTCTYTCTCTCTCSREITQQTHSREIYQRAGQTYIHYIYNVHVATGWERHKRETYWTVHSKEVVTSSWLEGSFTFS